jgi:hypothetical protein
MNSPNQQPRQFVHNTCELSIDDKKSPFPAWMKFNKPHPLRFALTVNDPDRPELEPMRVEGDRTKLEALHQTVEDYVKKLLARAPLPQINGEDPAKLPHIDTSAAFSDDFNTGSLQHRPIDALKVNDERPRIEADGISRHLFYLGSGADANTNTMSLSTLQLFDLSSALSEGVTPVMEPEAEPEKPAPLAAEAETVVKPVVLPLEIMTNSSKNSVTSTLKSDDVQEPRVVLPSANSSKSGASEDLYGLETESSILERSTPVNERFKKPSLNLPELPDFSRSPLTSVPLWLGLGGMAALIIAFPFLSSQFKSGNSVAKKPVPPTTQVATVPNDTPTPYQPTNPVVSNGVGTPSPSLPSLNTATPSGGIGTNALNSPGILGQNIGQGPIRANAPLVSSNNPGNSLGANTTSPNNRNLFNGGISTQAGLPSQLNNDAAAKIQQAQARATTNGKKPQKGSSDGTTNQFSPPRSLASINSGEIASDFNSGLRSSSDTTTATTTTKRGSQTRVSSKPSVIDNQITAPTKDFPNEAIIGQGVDLNSGGSGQLNTPLIPPQIESPKTLEIPTSPSESVQAKGLQNHFQGRWRADPNSEGSLQYRVRVGRNGKVISLEGADSRSQTYLDKTGFLKKDEVVSKSGQQDQRVWLILNSTGEVQTLADGE